MNKGYILDNKIEEEHNKYLFEIEKGKFIHVKELLSEFEYSQKLVEDLAKQLEEAYKKIDRLNNIIKEVREYIEKNLTKDDNGCGCWWYGFTYYEDAKQQLLDIIDKENEYER